MRALIEFTPITLPYLDIILFSFGLSLILGHMVFLFFNTDFFVEYCWKMPKQIRKFFLLEKYEEKKFIEEQKAPDFFYSYPIFIRERYNTFFGRLFGCPLCLMQFQSVLVGLIVSIVCKSILPLFVSFLVGSLSLFVFLGLSLLFKKAFKE